MMMMMRSLFAKDSRESTEGDCTLGLKFSFGCRGETEWATYAALISGEPSKMSLIY